jgi:hypothetical protein
MTDFADNNQVQRSFDYSRDLDAEYDASPWQRVNNNRTPSVLNKSLAKLLTCIGAIQKH